MSRPGRHGRGRARGRRGADAPAHLATLGDRLRVPPRDLAGGPAGQRFRAGVELVSLNVTVTDGTGRQVRHRSRAGGLRGLRRRRQAGVTFFSRVQQPIALAILLDTSNSMEEQAGDRAGSGDRLRASACARTTRSRSSTSTARSASRSRSPTTRTRSNGPSGRRRSNGSTSLYNAIYVSLKELKKRARQARRKKSAGRRSSCCPTATTPRA